MKLVKYLMSRFSLVALVVLVGASVLTVGCSDTTSLTGPTAEISDDVLFAGGSQSGGGKKNKDSTTTDTTDAADMDGGSKHAVGHD